jgi:hypothetical protein
MRLASEGLPGKALDLLERASARFPDSIEVRRRLADSYLFYGLVERSAVLYEEVLEQAPADDEARRGLLASLEAVENPSF